MFTDPILLAFAGCMAFLGATLSAWFWPKEPPDTPHLPPAQGPRDQSLPSSSSSKADTERIGQDTIAEPLETHTQPDTTWSQRLSLGLGKTRDRMRQQWEDFFATPQEKQNRGTLFETVLETLIGADVGVTTADALVAKLKTSAPSPLTLQALTDALESQVVALLEQARGQEIPVPAGVPKVVLMVGVNGVGKTTTAGKLAAKAARSGSKVVLGAADTFRAAAVEQLALWAKRAGAQLIELPPGSDPASVAFDAVKKSQDMGAGLCLIDTAGRLHNNGGLMDELSKIKRVVSKAIPSAPHEVLLVLDATTGQNALNQAKIFGAAAGVTGLVLTKLDGTAKGGVALAITRELGLPIRYIGVGESEEDLEEFVPKEFAKALFS